jgi:hypothetical protein
MCTLCALLTYAASGVGGKTAHVEAWPELAPAPPAPAVVQGGASRVASLIEQEGPVDSIIRGEVTRDDLKAPLPPGERKVRVGVTKAVDARVEFSNLRPQHLTATPRTLSQGAIRGNGSGGFVWTGVVESPGAAALRLRFAGFFLPRNSELHLYNNQGEVFGPYTGRGPRGTGEFWSHTLRGSRVTLQLSYNGTDTARALRATRFVVADVGHLDDKFIFALFGPTGDEAASNLCSFNAYCIVNASSASIPPDIRPARDAVAMILFASGRYHYICSGGLLADTDSSSVRPLFLTANHCVSKGREANSLEAYFQFSAPPFNCYTDLDVVSRTLGSSILATGKRGDFTLLELAQRPPDGSAFLGWNASPVAFDDGTPLFRISHPRGAPQAYSEHIVNTSRATCSGWPRGERIYSVDRLGATEGGSSGSPVLNAGGQVVGQLSGACGYNVYNDCDSVNNATVDGAFAFYFSEVEPFLDPSTSCTDADTDGWCVEEGDCNDGDPAVNPGAEENCNDSVDNDCDGDIDSADPDCQTGSCDLLPRGAPCDSDDQCCSNKCKGKPGNKTCK